MWVDIGCFRDESLIEKFASFPNISKFHPTKIQFLEVEPFTKEEKENTEVIDERFRYVNRIGGTMFTSPITCIEKFATIHKKMLDKFEEKKIFKGKDQSLFNFAILQNQDLFDIIKRPLNPKYPHSEWFYFHEYFSSPLHFVIIGPGIMPIPPKGWGAIEILIWDYAKTLESFGCKVTILNNSNLNLNVREIQNIKPDVVHIQYDMYGFLGTYIHHHTKVVAITSHYAYLEQITKWDSDSYTKYFHANISQGLSNLYHFVLSEGVANIYKKFNVNPKSIILAPNGVNDISFRYSQQPLYPERSIYLGKMDPLRKRQQLFQNIESLYFVGNVGCESFNTKSERYLGEWTKEVVYEKLTHYGNLVLLSNGEADPLVIKEALVCGLGVVISNWSVANLDLDKPYITIIHENRISDLAFVESEIIKNREYSINHRDEIRQYGLTFSWTNRVKTYLNNMKNLVKQHSI